MTKKGNQATKIKRNPYINSKVRNNTETPWCWDYFMTFNAVFNIKIPKL